MNREAIAKLSSISEPRRVAKDEIVFSEDEPADTMFILAEGEVDLVKYAADGRERFVRRVGVGETFAEAAMFAGEAYPVNAIARKASALIVIGRDRFHEFVREHPDASIAMLGAMAGLLRHWSELLSELSLASVEGRIAAWLLKRARKSGSDSFKLGIPKKELAFKLGTIPETLSRNLKKLTDAGVIRMTGGDIAIRDVEALEDLASR